MKLLNHASWFATLQTSCRSSILKLKRTQRLCLRTAMVFLLFARKIMKKLHGAMLICSHFFGFSSICHFLLKIKMLKFLCQKKKKKWKREFYFCMLYNKIISFEYVNVYHMTALFLGRGTERKSQKTVHLFVLTICKQTAQHNLKLLVPPEYWQQFVQSASCESKLTINILSHPTNIWIVQSKWNLPAFQHEMW